MAQIKTAGQRANAKLKVPVLLLVLAGVIPGQNPNTAVFPGAVAADTDLLVAANAAQSTLTSSIGTTDTSIPVAATPFSTPTVVTIDNEVIKVCSITGNSLNVCSGGRGFHGTAASHSSGAAVVAYVDSYYFNQLAAEIKAIEGGLGAGFVNVALTSGTYTNPGWLAITSLGPMSFTGGLTFATDNAYDIGASGGNRPRNAYFAGNIGAGGATNLLQALTVNGGIQVSGFIYTGSGGGIKYYGGANLFDGGSTTILVTGGFKWATDNTYDIGLSGASRPRNVYIGGQYNGSGAGLTNIPWTSLSGSPTAAQIGGAGTLTNPTSGNANTATALSSTPTQCSGGQFATGIAASGNANCATPAGGAPSVVSTSATSYSVSAATSTVIKASAASNNVAVTLFTAVGNSGAQVVVKRMDATTNTMTIGTTSSQTIDGNSTIQLFQQYDSVTLVSDGSNWVII